MSELKPCPFCGKQPVAQCSSAICINDDCELSDYWRGLEDDSWNTRPIEDALNARIAELEAEKSILEDQLREANNYLVDKKLHIDSLYEEGYKLQQRIAELEAESERFAVHSDIGRKVDKSPNDTQTQKFVYGKESEE